MIRTCVIALVLVVACVLAYAATRPSTFTVQRSIAIAAPPEKIYPLISDLHNWLLWAPQDKEDPSMHRTFSGSPSGKGASSSWNSKGRGGAGEMTITSAAPHAIAIQVNWKRPFQLQNLNSFTLEPNGAVTTVTWTMQGASTYPLKVMSVFVSPTRMMGSHFDSGVRDLKALAER